AAQAMHDARATLRAVVDSLHLVSGAGERTRVEGRLTPKSGGDGVPEVVVTFFAADGRELGTASAPVQTGRGENAGRFTVPAPEGSAGYRYTLRFP
ncbi:MAG: hypothetical protein ACJ8J0_01355, partial [Longimicrobiaceae bacterium]